MLTPLIDKHSRVRLICARVFADCNKMDEYLKSLFWTVCFIMFVHLNEVQFLCVSDPWRLVKLINFHLHVLNNKTCIFYSHESCCSLSWVSMLETPEVKTSYSWNEVICWVWRCRTCFLWRQIAKLTSFFFPVHVSKTFIIISAVSTRPETQVLHLVPNEVFIKATLLQSFIKYA